MATTEDQDAPVDQTAAQPTTPLAAEREVTPTTPASSALPRGLALAGIIGGGVAAAALLFGGGLALGVALPDRGPIGFAHSGLPGGHPGMHEGGPGALQSPHGDGERPEKQDRRGERETDAAG